MDARSKALRQQIVKTLVAGRRGHPGPALSLVEILRVLYDSVLRHDPANPGWQDRDRCILSKGHGCLALYVLLQDKGYFEESCLWSFCQADSILGGHPERGRIPGVEASTGSLGHGFSIGIGFALNARFEKSPSRTFVVMGDGECDEGSTWEAAMCAGKHKLENLVVLVDHNKLQSYGPVAEVQDLSPFADKWRAFGFGAAEVDGHDVDALTQVLSRLPLEPGKPSAVICHTVKGKGLPQAENNPSWHHKSAISEETAAELLAAIAAY
jgi:transketolase